jgi:general secretion pathway protein G
MTRTNPARLGYTLIELLIVLGVLGLLATMAMPLAEVTVQRERERELKRALWEIRDAIDAYHNAHQAGIVVGAQGGPGYPTDLVALTHPVVDARPERRGELVRFLRRVPRDPFADPALPPERSWGLRSYLSDADAPQAGSDVYDVYSRSEVLGLNGVPLKQW